MKPIPENLKILEKLGFTCDFERTGDLYDLMFDYSENLKKTRLL